ncbi:cytochrome P450 [Jatrophihabitans fulvus]
MTTADLSLDDLSGPGAAAALARVREAGPVVHVPALDGWLVVGHAAALAVMRDAGRFTVDDPRFSTAQVVGPSMLSTDGPEHRRHRSPFGPPFRAAELEQRYGDVTRTLAADLVARVEADGHADLRATLAGPLAVAVVAHALGLEVDAAEVLRWYTAIVAAVTALSAGQQPDGPERAAVADLGDAVRAGLRAGRSPLLAAAGGTLAEDEIVSNAAVMMFGGIETTEGMIANLLVHLLSEPARAAQVAADRTLVPVAVEESLRLEPAAAVVDRYATADADLFGAPVRRGDLVRVSVAAANRDPAVFDRPDDFAFDRANVRSQLAFARGPHACVAMDLARLETRVALETVLDRLPGLRLEAPVAATGLVFRKPASVPVRWRPAP